ncbi:helix-turn-helix transcriptional regulator [Olsenella sp. SW781]|uniref:helix-turn-helix domain-containing protein n=1 Tax=Olsenella sp. SW781 TaxID=2530046 RepID=UPI00143BC823|nr:helix-turn-helix transcriptional regulator [Olsenella sp. SW781]
MRRFEVIDGERPGGRSCGVLSYDQARRTFSFEAAPGATTRDVPAMFAPFLERGERRVPERWVAEWVSERIAPPSRQNIGEVLRANDLESYDPAVLLAAGRGRSTQDGFYLREIGDPYLGGVILGEGLRAARTRAGLSQEGLARKSGISQEAISVLERGSGNPTMRTLERLARALGCGLHIEFS